MRGNTVALVGSKSVVREVCVVGNHEPVSRHFGYDRGGGNRNTPAVASNKGELSYGEWSYWKTVNQRDVRPQATRKRLQRHAHRAMRGAQNVDCIDFSRLDNTGSDATRRRQNPIERGIALLGRQQL